ncbi:MAG: LptF/LptG family permease [Candidatus Eremiobacteraeota bacterium]|nr:LptF/LptG family permease [Candidatus Eremiobacteraeota bacterium]MBV8285042.1 LptF/LptG family permease [Candidatus Eremiobacteraeota bacterium]MBV8332570.1 LptF/LptG family permease [Candidatus Eremiobacteraeota bacterium]MBV8722722.1 LptF/LptG family permease [Candidatus Eremiobacteraeota bacterium]
MLAKLKFTILDRYMLDELSGPFGFGLAAFTLIFAATEILNIGKLVSNDHAPLWAALLIFLWSLPGQVVLVIPMALLLGTLLTVARLSGDSEITALKAAGVTFTRIVTPLLAVGIVMSFVTFFLQEQVVPYANDQLTEIENAVINHTSAFNRDLTVSAKLPGGGRQVTLATAYEPNSRALLHVTLVQYDNHNQPRQIVFADRAEFTADKWVLANSSVYRFNPDGTTLAEPHIPAQQVELGENPTDLVKRLSNDDPENMSRAQIADVVRSGQLTETEYRKYVTTYQEKLARPFACFVFILIAIPFGLRSIRGGGSASLGFGVSLAIVFVYYIVMTICSFLGEAMLGLAWFWAWMPNIVFTAIGLTRLRRVALV